MFCRAATSSNGKDCWAPDFLDALVFADADFDEGAVAVLAAAGLRFATACGESPSVLFGIKGNLDDRLAHFLAFYEHAGLFRCTNRAEVLSQRTYELPVFFQQIKPLEI
jgi:hypothetical protein